MKLPDPLAVATVECPACRGTITVEVHADGMARDGTVTLRPTVAPHDCGPRGGGEELDVAA